MNTEQPVSPSTAARTSPSRQTGHPGARPRLLFLAQTLPFPPDGGVQIRTYNVLRLLAREFDVTALCFYRKGLAMTADRVRDSVRELGRIAHVEEFPIPQEHSRGRMLLDHARSALSRRVYTVGAYSSAHFRQRLETLLRTERFDLVHMDSLDLAGYLPLLHDIPVVCVHHNVESALLRSRANTFGALRRWYLRLQARLMEKEERRWLPRVALNVAVSADDAAGLRALAPTANVVVVPNGVDTSVFSPDFDLPTEGLVFVGGHSWQPNRDAMDFFCAEILPLLRAAGVDPTVTWVGSASDEARRAYAERHRVHLTGYVDDIRPFVLAASCYVAPLRAGGGTRLKILDGWAMGKAMVSTTVGCEGLDARDAENILVRDSPAAFAQSVGTILGDAALRRRLGEQARRTTETTYDWEVIGREMLAHYRALLTPGRRHS